MDPPGRRRGHGRHHQICRRKPGRRGVRGASRQRQDRDGRRRSRGSGKRQGRQRHLRAGRRHRHRRQCGAGKGALQGQRRPGRRGLVLQADAVRQKRIRQADGQRRLCEVRGLALMRYLPLTQDDRRAMLARIGAPDVDALFRDVPKSALTSLATFDLPDTQGELEVERALSKLAARNIAAGAAPFFCGAGAYKHHVPSAVDHLIQRSEFLTSYTPYQPEIAQGTLQYLFEFQTQVALLTGMEVATASLYDGSTAAAEAGLMAHRLTGRDHGLLAGNLHPHYAETIRTVARGAGDIVSLPPGADATVRM